MPLRLIEKYTEVFIETGTFWGDGVQFALDSGYTKVVSIELFDKYFHIGTQRFAYNPNVKIVHGDSGLILGEVIKDFNEPITFWLDGHFSGEGTAFGIKEMPLLEELAHIKSHSIKTHTILIDDVKCWKNHDTQLNFDSVINAITSINPNYSFYTMDSSIKDDILVCKIEPISLT